MIGLSAGEMVRLNYNLLVYFIFYKNTRKLTYFHPQENHRSTNKHNIIIKIQLKYHNCEFLIGMVFIGDTSIL